MGGVTLFTWRMGGSMESRIQKHDQQQFEIKLSYPLARDHRTDRYEVDVFLFLPYQLGVDESRYTTDQFYKDLNCYTRFKTPVFTLAQLHDATLSANPRARVEKKLAEAAAGGALDERGVLYELKVLGNIIRVQVRDRARVLGNAAREKRASVPETMAQLLRLAEESEQALDDLRGLEPQLEAPTVTHAIRRTYHWVDEYLSVETEGYLIHLLRSLELHGEAGLETVRARLAESVRRESAYRMGKKHAMRISSEARRNEKFLYRESLLKKFCANVLFLNVQQRVGDRRARALLYSVAAGVAMAFAVGAALVAGKYWPQGSAAFSIILILAYILKDRLKEFVREYGNRLLPRWASDRAALLVDPKSGRVIGSSRERMRWRDSDTLPREVIEARRFLYDLEHEVCGRTDRVIHYVKELRVKTDAVYLAHQRSVAIDDIFRFNVGRWLERMDNPWEELVLLPDGSAMTETAVSPRVYHVNVVMRLEEGGKVAVQTARLVLDRSGILRVETNPCSRHEGL